MIYKMKKLSSPNNKLYLKSLVKLKKKKGYLQKVKMTLISCIQEEVLILFNPVLFKHQPYKIFLILVEIKSLAITIKFFKLMETLLAAHYDKAFMHLMSIIYQLKQNILKTLRIVIKQVMIKHYMLN